jgi:TatD DNase family protein
MTITDTHTHLYWRIRSRSRRNDSRALEKDFRFFILSTLPTLGNVWFRKELSEHVFLMMGLHPTYVRKLFRGITTCRRSSEKKILCHWEIGIDLYWDKTFANNKSLSGNKFNWQNNINYLLWFIVEGFWWSIWNIRRRESPDLFGIFHCFTGTYEQALQAISYNMKLGIGGVVTFKKGKIDQFWIKLI